MNVEGTVETDYKTSKQGNTRCTSSVQKIKITVISDESNINQNLKKILINTNTFVSYLILKFMLICIQ